MRYYKVIQYGNDNDFSTKETIIDESTFRQYQKLISEGKDKIVLREAIISVSSIKEIVPADDIVAEYQRQGLKIDGLIEAPDRPELTGNVSEPRKISDLLKDKHFEMYQKNGWGHNDDCVCKM